MKSEEILISVIVPIYNVESFLGKCIKSIQEQTYSNIEIILVDDGSTDGSEVICDEFAQTDKRIKVIHKQNGGITSARKAGVNIAQGKYIGFVDGDDWIENNMYETMLKSAEENHVQIILSNMYRHKFTGEITVWESDIAAGIYHMDSSDGRYILQNLFSGINSTNRGVSGGVHVKLFLSELLKPHIQSIDDRIRGFADDKVIVYPTVLNAQSIQILDKAFYHGVDRKDSATHSITRNFFEQLQLVYDYLKSVFEIHPMQKCLMKQLHQFVMLSVISNTNNFAGETMIPEFHLSNIEEIYGKNIVLYGAGKVGRAYYKQIKANKISDIVLWIDKVAQKNKKIFPMVNIKDVEYDYVVVAVIEEMMYKCMYNDLIKLNVERKKILWIKPSYIIEYYQEV